ncbi:hypothetical protein [Sphaerisporangium perillae]|uniref:hypothetical protein n=1 Tax=Sphaerisporangium perillae TaxID=2935860 RepID=UPI00200D1862|nr:hypothetical protein [Sphaerisporangium perillae]
MSNRHVLRPLTGLAAGGLVAIGVSGAVAKILGRVFGAGFVSADLPGVAYTPERCADFVRYFPGKSCLEAAALHHWGEVVTYRVAAGILGLVLGAVWYVMRRGDDEPSGLAATIGLPLFGLAAAVLLLDTLNAAVAGGGPGASLSAGLVALAVAAYLAPPFYRNVLAHA